MARAACRVYLHLPEGGNPNEPKTEIVRWKGKLFQTDAAPSQPAKPLPGSILGYCVNGVWQVMAPVALDMHRISAIDTECHPRGR